MKKINCVVCGKVRIIGKRVSSTNVKRCIPCQKFHHNTLGGRKYRLKNPSKVEASNKKYIEFHPEKVKEAARKYRANHLEECRRRTRESQRKLNNLKRFGGLRYQVLERDDNKCVQCNETKKRISVHHINRDKTDHRMENLITLCQKCHAKFHYSIGEGIARYNIMRAK